VGVYGKSRLNFYFWFFETGSCYVVQAGLELVIFHLLNASFSFSEISLNCIL
jgi:hypothetical protein